MPDIVADDREPQRIIDKLSARGFSISNERLGAGDFVWDDIGIERKSLSDFLKSITPQKKRKEYREEARIWKQAQGLSEEYEDGVIIIHDRKWDLDDKEQNTYNFRKIYGTIIGLEDSFGLQVDWVDDIDGFIDAVDLRYQKGKKGLNRPYPTTPSSAPQNQRIENALCQASRVGIKKATSILSNEKSIENIAKQNLEELQEKYGEKTGEHLKELLSEEVEYDDL